MKDAESVAIRNRTGFVDSDNRFPVESRLIDEDSNDVGPHYPLEVDGDQVFVKDVDFRVSTSDGFTGTIADLLNDIQSTIINSSDTNPKVIDIHLKRPMQSNIFGFTTKTGNFSNTKITVYIGVGVGEIPIVILNESTDDTKKVVLIPPVAPQTFNRIKIEFYTADTCSLSFIGITKAHQRISRIQGISEISGLVEDVSTRKNALNVNAALVNTRGISVKFHEENGVASTLANAITKGDTDIDLVDATGFIVGDDIKIVTGSLQGDYFFRITSVVTNTLTLDAPVPIDVDAGTDVREVEYNMITTAGTLTAPVLYEIRPPAGAKWQITRLLISLTDASAMDDGKFGGITALTNGVLLRAHKSGSTGYQAVWKTNGDMALDMFDVVYTDKAPAGENGLRGRWTFTKAEFVLELDGDNGDYAEVVIQDDITANTSFEIKAQGRLFQE